MEVAMIQVTALYGHCSHRSAHKNINKAVEHINSAHFVFVTLKLGKDRIMRLFQMNTYLERLARANVL